MKKVKEYLSWVFTFIKSPEKFREKMREEILETLMMGPSPGQDSYSVGDAKKLISFLEDKKQVDFVGFSPNVFYMKEKGVKDDLESVFIHPFSMPTLLYAHKKLPVLFLVNPGIRFNKNILSEMKYNEKDFKELFDITGISS